MIYSEVIHAWCVCAILLVNGSTLECYSMGRILAVLLDDLQKVISDTFTEVSLDYHGIGHYKAWSLSYVARILVIVYLSIKDLLGGHL